MKDIRVAIVTFNSPVGRSKNNLDRMEKWMEKAKNCGASIICFPEMNVTGYSTKKAIINEAEPISGPISHSLLKSAKSNNIVVLAGMAEKDQNGRVFASHMVIKPDGEMGVYRKLHLAPPEHSVFSPGDRIPVFTACGINFGVQLCYDAHFPELSTYMALNKADVIFMPHASPRGTKEDKFRSWMRHLSARAYDNSVYVIACNQIGENGKGLCFPGIILIIGPSGEILKKKLSDTEEMVVADLKADDLARLREHKMRYFLPNRRPDLFGFMGLGKK